MSTTPGQRSDSESARSPLQIVHDWWWENIAAGSGEKRHVPAGPRAELRRAGTLDEVVFVPLFHDLRRRLLGTAWHDVDRLALVAGVLAHVRQHEGGKSFAGQMVIPAEGSKTRPRISPARFRRLLRIDDGNLEDLFQQVRRMIAQLDGVANVEDLAQSLYWWNAETRKRWALAYYDKVDEHALKNE